MIKCVQAFTVDARNVAIAFRLQHSLCEEHESQRRDVLPDCMLSHQTTLSKGTESSRLRVSLCMVDLDLLRGCCRRAPCHHFQTRSVNCARATRIPLAQIKHASPCLAMYCFLLVLFRGVRSSINSKSLISVLFKAICPYYHSLIPLVPQFTCRYL